MLVYGPKFVESRNQLLQLLQVGGELFSFVNNAVLKILEIELRNVVPHLFEVGEDFPSTVKNMLREDVLFTVDPEMVKSFLSTVENLGKVGTF